MKFTKDQWQLHCGWGLPAIAVMVGCIGWYVVESTRAGTWLGGGSAPGLLCGIAAGGIIAFEMLLWPRKFFRRFRLIPARHWMAAHLWLGFVSLPLAVFHCGFHQGGTMTAVFLWLFILTIVSGVYGLVVQNVLPRWMLKNLPGETIYSQIDHLSTVAVEDARLLLISACGRNPYSDDDDADHAAVPSPWDLPGVHPTLVGSLKSMGPVQGRTICIENIQGNPEDAKVLWKAYDVLKLYLIHGKRTGGVLANPANGERWFETLRRSCDPASGEVVDALQYLFHQRQQFDIQQTMHRWLHAWIPVHVGLSVAVTVLLVAHVFLALKYW